ncbi:MAG: hypothetical protein RRY78_04145 [Clostridia bacterium]
MIYKNNYLNKELKEAFIDKKNSNKNMFWISIFLGVISFAIYFLFQSMTESVIKDFFPSIISPSYFATLYLYINLSTIFFIFYNLFYYDLLTFSEMRKSKWYVLIKTGRSSIAIIVLKMFARFVNTFIIYTLGFLATLIMTSVLNYKFIILYIFPLFLSGIIQILFMLFLILFFSLVSSNKTHTKYAIIFAFVSLFIFKCLSGYYSFESNKILMQNIGQMIIQPYILVLLCFIFVLLIATIFYAKKRCFYSHRESKLQGKIAIIDKKTNDITGVVKHKKLNKKWFEFILNGAVLTVILLALGLNVFVLVMSNDRTDSAIKPLNGKVPYIFSSSTMSPIIEKNDLAFFKKIDQNYTLKVGDVIMFKDDNVTYVEKILEINDKIIVDIVAYPPNSAPNSMRKIINRNQVEAIHTNNNRILGATILFSNSAVGRVVLLIIPIIFIFFNKSIFAKLRKYKKQIEYEEYFVFDKKSAVIMDFNFDEEPINTLEDMSLDSTKTDDKL